MPRATVPILKFIGTFSVGLLTGVSYATATSSIPSLYALPTAYTASAAYHQHQQSIKRTVYTLSVVSAGSYLLAFGLSPVRGGRHPYLVWTALVVGISGGLDLFLSRRDDSQASLKGKNRVREEDFVDIERSSILNGEEVKQSVDRWRFREIVRGSVTGLAFAMGVVGLWGDGAGAVRARR